MICLYVYAYCMLCFFDFIFVWSIGIYVRFRKGSREYSQTYLVLLKEFFNQIYQSKDCLRLRYLTIFTTLSKYTLSPNVLNQIAQSLIKITQETSINAISVDGIKFSIKEIEFFNFWFSQPFGEATINENRDRVLLIRYLDQRGL